VIHLPFLGLPVRDYHPLHNGDIGFQPHVTAESADPTSSEDLKLKNANLAMQVTRQGRGVGQRGRALRILTRRQESIKSASSPISKTEQVLRTERFSLLRQGESTTEHVSLVSLLLIGTRLSSVSQYVST
jgi:hypothetical protein